MSGTHIPACGGGPRSSTGGVADYSQPSPRALGYRVSVVAPDPFNRIFGQNCHHQPRHAIPKPPSPTHTRPRRIPSGMLQRC